MAALQVLPSPSAAAARNLRASAGPRVQALAPCQRPLRVLHYARQRAQTSCTGLVCHAASATLDGIALPYESEPAPTWQEFVPGQVLTVHSRAEFDSFLSNHKHQLVVLMAKASHCRPCKMFSRKYSRLAERLVDAAFLDIIGDETTDTRRMMMDLQVKATPTFRIYRGQQFITTLTGSNEKKLTDAVMEQLLPTEAGYGANEASSQQEEQPRQ